MISAFHVVSYSLIAMLVCLIGGTLASLTHIHARLSSFFNHLVAGIVIGAVAIDLLPYLMQSDHPIETSIGFAFGAFSMILIHILMHVISQKSLGRILPLGLIAASCIDLFIDGLLIGVSFIAGMDSGLLITFSLSFCAFFLALSVMGTMKKAQNSALSMAVVLVLLSIALPIGAFIGTTLIRSLPTYYLTETLSFGVAALLFLGTEELLKHTHRIQDTLLSPLLFFLGFWAVLIFKML